MWGLQAIPTNFNQNNLLKYQQIYWEANFGISATGQILAKKKKNLNIGIGFNKIITVGLY